MRSIARGGARSWLALALLAALATAAPAPSSAATSDPLRRKIRSQLTSFIRWLDQNDARGYVGEVGWPDDVHGDADRWNALARDWYDLALAEDLWVSAWATGEWWDDYKLSIYEATREGTGVDRRNTQAPVLEAAASHGGRTIGINVNGGEFGSPISSRESRFSNARPGAYDTRYHYDSQATFDYLGSRGVGHVRIPFRWERIQPHPGGPLDDKEVARLRAAVGRAWRAGMKSILDVHNYGAYYLERDGRGVRTPIGSRALPLDRFADLWRRLSSAFRDDRRIAMYALMAEPYGMPKVNGKAPKKVWERAAQRAVSAIRSNGDKHLIAVPGYGWDALQVFMRNHPRAWIRDPANSVVYEVHHYWDRDYSGDYERSYASEADAAREAGW